MRHKLSVRSITATSIAAAAMASAAVFSVSPAAAAPAVTACLSHSRMAVGSPTWVPADPEDQLFKADVAAGLMEPNGKLFVKGCVVPANTTVALRAHANATNPQGLRIGTVLSIECERSPLMDRSSSMTAQNAPGYGVSTGVIQDVDLLVRTGASPVTCWFKAKTTDDLDPRKTTTERLQLQAGTDATLGTWLGIGEFYDNSRSAFDQFQQEKFGVWPPRARLQRVMTVDDVRRDPPL